MIEFSLEKHIEAVRRELRVRAWNRPRVEAAWRALALRHLNSQTRRQRVTTIGGVALAAAAALALAIVAMRTLAPSSPPLARGAASEAPTFERLTLGDGSEVRLERGARLDVRERTDTRVVVTVGTGRARFKVRHDPRRLFRVEAGDVNVEDLGTTFDVEHEARAVRVSVSEGAVRVSFAHEGGGRRTVTLSAGQSGVYSSNTARPALAEPPNPVAEDTAAAAASAEVASGTAETQASVDWRELARAGKHRRAYDVLAPGGFRDVRNEPGDLLLASDVARLSRHPAESAMLLRRLLKSYGRDPRAPSAAFTLGWVLMNELGRPREAATAFAQAEALAPGGNLAEDAVARAVEARYRAGELSRARMEVERYRTSYPNGRHQAMLQRLVGTP